MNNKQVKPLLKTKTVGIMNTKKTQKNQVTLTYDFDIQ